MSPFGWKHIHAKGCFAVCGAYLTYLACTKCIRQRMGSLQNLSFTIANKVSNFFLILLIIWLEGAAKFQFLLFLLLWLHIKIQIVGMVTSGHYQSSYLWAPAFGSNNTWPLDIFYRLCLGCLAVFRIPLHENKHACLTNKCAYLCDNLKKIFNE